MDKFYEVQQRSSGRWRGLGFFRKKGDARRYMELFNTKVTVYPVRIAEKEFLDIEQAEEDHSQ